MLTIAFKEPVTPVLTKAHLRSTKGNEATTHIRIPLKNGVKLVPLQDVICFEADRSYTRIYTRDNEKYLLAKTLKSYESLSGSNRDFIRVHKSYIVRKNAIRTFLMSGELLLAPIDLKAPVARRRKTEVLRSIHQMSI